MPWSKEQWAAIAARAMREKGPVAGRRYLHKLKQEAGGRAVKPLPHDHPFNPFNKRKR